MSYATRPIHVRLKVAALAIRSALEDPEVLALLAARSYDRKTLKEGERLYEKARTLSSRIPRSRAGQYGATEDVRDQLEALRKEYTAELTLTRSVLGRDRAAAAQLGLRGARKAALDAYLEQVRQFYAALSEDEALAAQMEPFGITSQTLKARRDALERIEEASRAQAGARGAAQELTRRRREALRELDLWMSRFFAVARIALRDQPQFIEKLGLTARA